MVFKKVKNTSSTYIYMPELADYNAEEGDIVIVDDEFFKILPGGSFEEVKFIFHLETENTNGI